MASFTTVNAFELDGGSFVVADVIAQEGTHFHKDMTEMVAGESRSCRRSWAFRLIRKWLGFFFSAISPR